ncbi:MAG: Uma2 family endonuclease [Spirochaetia bacterium]|nr:Uma2 family endonuclease [Spirochaetia bacterium]
MPFTAIQNKPMYEGRKVTREEYLDLEEDGFKYEMIDGVLYMSPSPFSSHGECQINLGYCLRAFFIDRDAGKAISEVDIFLPDGGDVLRPDITVVLKENYGIIKGHIHGVPDIVAEILSEATQARDLGAKAERYLFNGVKEYWIIDPDKKSIAIWINLDNKKWQKKDGNRMESSALTGFILQREEIFPSLKT